jgi:hypothetical protein
MHFPTFHCNWNVPYLSTWQDVLYIYLYISLYIKLNQLLHEVKIHCFSNVLENGWWLKYMESFVLTCLKCWCDAILALTWPCTRDQLDIYVPIWKTKDPGSKGWTKSTRTIFQFVLVCTFYVQSLWNLFHWIFQAMFYL